MKVASASTPYKGAGWRTPGCACRRGPAGTVGVRWALDFERLITEPNLTGAVLGGDD